ncbi:HAMP domain-containing protein [Gilvimarinus sp. SDUM040013]|uniref:histidine kinase n=1 Tax=Gilvimarinus gilvus TaxID=3058038 RepID=A0ABU4S2Z7_9GAMM|nr:ATP-binding protein [Gilvimarinus sp. SDUM040013]MDO3385181.1 HAMP domain-containing protein [Gilvimarinus sp. SDUM040013]MDX6851547.1 HAMP domain-containing protein [Gilvimarinus sp. SDUM040013]
MKLKVAGFAGRLFLWFWLSLTLLIVGNFFASHYFDDRAQLRQPTARDAEKLEMYSRSINSRQPANIHQIMRSRIGHTLIILDPKSGNPIRDQRRHWRLTPLFDVDQVHVMKLGPGIKVIGPFTITTKSGDYQAFWMMPRTHVSAWRQLLYDSPKWRLAGSMCLVLILSLILARWLSRPVQALTQAARQLGNGQLDVRVAPGKGEFGELAHEFNSMADKLQAAMASQQRLVADVSHELRSPLTRLKLAAGMLSEQMDNSHVKRIEKECNTLDHLIEQVLTLARLEGSVYKEQSTRVDLVNLIQSSVEDWRFQSERTDITYSGPAFLEAYCKPHLMLRIFDNLLANACRYATSVQLYLKQTDSGWLLTIEDNGPGVSDEQIQHLFEPFYRADPARSHQGNFGLGLAITLAAAQAQGIRIRAGHAKSGGLQLDLSG